MSRIKFTWLEAKDLDAKKIDVKLDPIRNIVFQFDYNPWDINIDRELHDEENPWYLKLGWSQEAQLIFWQLLYKAYTTQKGSLYTKRDLACYKNNPPNDYILDSPTTSKNNWYAVKEKAVWKNAD